MTLENEPPTTGWKVSNMLLGKSEGQSWETCMQVKKQQLELDMEQQTVSKLGKDCLKPLYCHSAYLIYMQSTYIMRYARLDEAQAGTKTAGRNTNNWDDTTLMAESEELKSLLMRVKKLA